MTLARIGRFQVERTLGSGTFATVWLARDEDLDAMVAIKLLGDAWSRSDDARRRFIDEARALRRLDDDRIVRVYEVGRLADDRPYMVMEYADRGTLEDRMQLRAQLGQPFTVGEAVELSTAVAECLIAVHDHRIVHRDVKPSNVLFRSLPPERREALRREGRPPASERVLLGDFGIARLTEGSGSATMVVGSPRYMAPEQADPERAMFADGRSDVYSAAVVLFELLMGRVPFGFESIGELQRASSADAPPVLRRTRPDVPADLARVIHRGLSRDPAHRYPSARAWVEAVSASGTASPDAGAASALVDLRDPQPATVGRPPVASYAPARVPSRSEASTLDPAVTVRSSPPTAPTMSLEAPSGTHVLPHELPVTSPLVVPARGPVPRLRLASVAVVVAGAALVVSPALPWTAGAGASGVRRAVIGTALDAGAVAAILGGVLLVSGWGVWRARRRWAAITWSALAALSGVAGLSVGFYVELSGVFGSSDATPGPGALTLWAGSALALLAGWGALRRLRRQPPPLALGVPTAPGG